ncbi:hypothetical protein CN689_03995 [Peribacillus butanolivorans]|uniref:PEGA domain-containing protein n=1 Tax=Peribacillus butanolivorans TaxID=421767 RepID=A0AAX0S8J1_9BACI|nr:hypothetical protein [Peribacillus butanolivorans]PEJ36619.1 hypothetical protein CN689_03995 [Peribacillus butanolivorans]
MEIMTKVKQHKVITTILAFVIFGIILLTIISTNQPTSEELVNDFERAIIEGDVKTLEKLLDTEDKEMKLTEKGSKQLISYAQEDPEYLKELIFIMKAQAAILDQNQAAKTQNPIFQHATEGEILEAGDYYVKKSEGLFSSPHIYTRSYSLTVSVEEPKSTIKIENKKVLTTTKNRLETTLHHLPPGTYNVSASKKYKYATVTDKEKIQLFEEDEFKDNVALDVSGNRVAIESNADNVSIFVNGKDTGEKATVVRESSSNSSEEVLFGPFSNNGATKIHGEVSYPWGKAKSAPQSIGEYTESIDVTPNPFQEKSNKEQIVQLINDYSRQRMQALVQGNASLIKTASDNIVREYTEDIQNDKEYKYYWKGKALGTRINFGQFTLNQEQDQYTVRIPVEFHDKQKEYGGWTTDETDPLEENFEDAWIELTYDNENKNWTVNSVDNVGWGKPDGWMEGNQVVKSEFK